MAQKRAVVRQSFPDIIAADLRQRILSGDLAEGEAHSSGVVGRRIRCVAHADS
ncbi:hypothetical protein [Marinomonas rhodophyticola]|uniref:GntR family transcriptional regulator n=1 Tax=Marinomonas rhodophyticola TaxID=2992803 RepID=A0ABT3KIR3_9GAMM|nr:hypothetical protein [Marinomonas sp. KJ51-3]MCW4630319.1 hypothetical protein [Marinomonas sp. KJ51-3]